MLNNEDIQAMLGNVKLESNIYFDKMDNSFINEIANKTNSGDKWKYFQKFVSKKQTGETEFGMKQLKENLQSLPFEAPLESKEIRKGSLKK